MHNAQMKPNFALVLICFVLACSLGCYSTPEGRFKPGVPLAKDTLEYRFQRPVSEIFGASKEVLKFNGTLTGENTINNSLIARIDTRTVWVQVDEVEPQVSRVRVTARKKAGTPDIDLASEVATQIALRLR